MKLHVLQEELEKYSPEKTHPKIAAYFQQHKGASEEKSMKGKDCRDYWKQDFLWALIDGAIQ